MVDSTQGLGLGGRILPRSDEGSPMWGRLSAGELELAHGDDL